MSATLSNADGRKLLGKTRLHGANKYKAVRTIIDGVKFHSKREAEDWCDLKQRERAGEITNLRRQVAFELFAHTPAGPVKICTYVADFVFFDREKDREVVADSKGVSTALFKLKAKLFKANYGREIELL